MAETLFPDPPIKVLPWRQAALLDVGSGFINKATTVFLVSCVSTSLMIGQAGGMCLERGRRDFRTWKKPLQGTFSAGDARYGCFDRAGEGGDM